MYTLNQETALKPFLLSMIYVYMDEGEHDMSIVKVYLYCKFARITLLLIQDCQI